MQTFLITSAILSWFVILFNLILGLVLVRRFRQLDVDHKPEVLQSGEKAPNFSLESLDGGITSLEDYKNQESLMVFVSPSCEPCRAQMPQIKALASQIEASGTQLLMVSLGDKEQTREFIDEFEMGCPVLISEYGGSFATNYKVPGTPAYYYINKKGIINGGGFFDKDWLSLTKKWDLQN